MSLFTKSSLTKLLLIDALDNPCCPIDIEPKEVELDFIYPDDSDGVRIKLLYSKSSDTYLLPLEVLQHIFSQAPEEFFEIQAFEIDNQKVLAEICSPTGETRSWQEAMEALQTQANPPTLTPKDVAEFQQHDEVWQFITAFAGRVGEDAEVATMALISNSQGAIVRQQVVMGQVKVEAIAQLLLQAIAYPMAITDTNKPKQRIAKKILISDQTDFVLLTSALDNLNLNQFDIDIQIEQTATAIADEIVQDIQKAMQVPARILDGVAKETLQNYFEATTVFYENEYWNRVEGKRYLAFQIIKDGTAGEWHYANLMGQMGEEFGLAIFENWLEICKLESNIPSPMAMMSMMLDGEDYLPKTKREAISLTELDFLHPDDEDAVLELENHINYRFREDYPLPMSIGMGGIEAPEFSLENYTYLMQAIHEVFSKRKADVIKSIKKTVELEDCTVNLRLPAKGNESFIDLPEAQTIGTYLLTINGQDTNNVNAKKLGKGKQLQIEVSGDAHAYDVIKALEKQMDVHLEGFGYIDDPEVQEELDAYHDYKENSNDKNAFYATFSTRDSVTSLWSRREIHSAKPFIFQIAEVATKEKLWITGWLDLYELHIERINDSPRPKDDIRITQL